MDQDPVEELRRRLGTDCSAIESMDADQRRQLLELLDEARAHQERALYRALNGALDFLPRILRGPVKRFFRN